MSSCVFCRIVAKEIPAAVVYEDELTIAFMDAGQVNPGHVLVAAKGHAENLYELNDAFNLAAKDDDISVIILAANGPHFSSGHDLREADPIGSLSAFETVGTWCGFGCAGAEGWMAREKELYQ